MKKAEIIIDEKRGVYRCSACDWEKNLSADAALHKRADGRVKMLVFWEFYAHAYEQHRAKGKRQKG